MSSPALTTRRDSVREQLRALERPHAGRRTPPPQGQLGASEQTITQLRVACETLGPVFIEFARYLSTRLDMLPRRDCHELAATGATPETRRPADALAVLHAHFGHTADRQFASFTVAPRVVTRWTQQHDAWLSNDMPVVVTIVRPDAQALLDADLPLLSLLAPWLDTPTAALNAAIADFALTLRFRLDQTQLRDGFARLMQHARADGPLDAPRCYPELCSMGVLTAERVEGRSVADALAELTMPGAPGGEPFDPGTVATQLAAAWLRLTISGHAAPFDFDLNDLVLRDGRLVLVGGALEPMTGTEGPLFLKYLLAGAVDDPDAALEWIASEAAPGLAGVPEDSLRRRLRQAVPFRDGEWSGDDRLAERLLVHWRATRAADWDMPAHYLRLYRGIHALSAATTALAPYHDHVLAALHDEQWRIGTAEARNWLDTDKLALTLEGLSRDLVLIPQKLDEILTAAASGRLRITADVPDADERRVARNRTVSLVASLVTLVALTFVLRHVTPAHGSTLEWMAALIVLMVGGWLLIAASRL